MTISTILLEMTRGVLVTAAVIGLARVALKRVLTPKAKYYLWLLLLVRMMLPVLPESPLSLMNFLPTSGSSQEAPEDSPVLEQRTEAPAVSGDSVWWEHAPAAAPEAPQAPQFSSEAPTIAADTAVWEAPAAPQAPEIPAATILLWIWLGGVGVVLLVYLTLYAITARQLRRLPCATDSDTLRMFLRLKRELGIHGKVNLVTGGGGMLGGIWQPTVVIPAERHGEDLAPILVHELLHYKYKDMWLSLLFRLMTAVHWFNPVVWLCFHLMRLDCEAACDQRVLESGLVQPSSYATLLYEEGVLQMKNGILMQTTFGGGRHSLRRRIRLIAQFQPSKARTTVLAVALALVVTACTMTGATSNEIQSSASLDFDAYMQSYEPPNGIFGLTFEEHVARGLLDPDQGTLAQHTYQNSDMTYSIFTTSMELGGESVEIAYSFGQNVLSEDEILKQVFVTPPENVPMGTWLERISDPWLSGMTQNTDLNGWEWNTQEYVADFLTEEQLNTVIRALVADGQNSSAPDAVKSEEDAEWALKTNWRVVSAFSSGPVDETGPSVWQFNGTGAALIRAAQAETETVGNPATADQLPAGMDMDSYIEAIQPGFGHYGWTFQEHVDAGLLSEDIGEWEYQNDMSSGFMTTVELNGSTLEAEFIFSQTLFTRGTDGPQVLTEVHITIPSSVMDGIQWGLNLMEPWAEYMTLGGNGSEDNFCATPVMVGAYLTDEQREIAAQEMVELGYADFLGAARQSLYNWYIAGGWYMANKGVWQFNGTGAALYLTRPNPKPTDGAGAASSSGETAVAGEPLTSEELQKMLDEYQPFGITYDEAQQQWYYNGTKVGYFRDVLTSNGESLSGGNFQGTMRSFSGDGSLEIETVRDYGKLNAEGYGTLTGITVSGQVTPPSYGLSQNSITYSSTQWGMSPEQVLTAEGLDAEQWPLHNRGKNYYMNGSIPNHPEVEEVEFQFHFTGLDLSLGLDYVEVEYNQDVISYEDLLALRREQFGPPTSTQGTTSSWDREDGGFTLTLTTNGFLREMLNYRGTLYDAEDLLANFDAEEYLSTIQPPNGHYGWTYDQHIAAGLLAPDRCTLVQEQDTDAGHAHSFASTIELGGETVQAVYVFSSTLASIGTDDNEVLTQVMVTPPEGVAISQWVASFSDSFTDKLFESSNLIYKSPVSVGSLLSEAQQEEIMDVYYRVHNDGDNITLGGWSLVQNWYQQEARVWHFNGTGAALYLTAIEHS